MKAILEFNLPDDNCDFKIASNAMEWALSINELDDWLRSQIKYGDKDELQPVRDQLHEILESYNLNLDMIE